MYRKSRRTRVLEAKRLRCAAMRAAKERKRLAGRRKRMKKRNVDMTGGYCLKLLALDPGTHITGYAYFEQLPPSKVALTQYGIIRASQDSWDLRCVEINSKIRNFMVTKQCNVCVVEFPQFQAGTRGMAAARGGDTLYLAYLCGTIACGWYLHMAESMREKKFLDMPFPTLITPSAWKGQLPKEITSQRCEKLFGIEARKTSEFNYSDAIMLGVYYLKQSQVSLHVVEKSPALRQDY